MHKSYLLSDSQRSRTVRRNFYRLGIDRRRAMIYCVAEKWHSVTPPIVNFVGAYDWQSTHCVGDTHYKINVHPIAFSYYWVGVASVTLTTEPFSFTLSVTPHGKGSPFENSVKICQNIIINEVAFNIVFKAAERDVG